MKFKKTIINIIRAFIYNNYGIVSNSVFSIKKISSETYLFIFLNFLFGSMIFNQAIYNFLPWQRLPAKLTIGTLTGKWLFCDEDIHKWWEQTPMHHPTACDLVPVVVEVGH